MQYSSYIKSTVLLAMFFYGLIILVLYQVEGRFHLSVYNHASLDSKLFFLKHHADIESADTIIIGSSMGLNNVNGVLLEDSSLVVDKVVNLSAWSMKCSYFLPIVKGIVSYGNVKRVIYPAQYFDFTPGQEAEGINSKTAFGYLSRKPVDTFLYVLKSSKNLINLIDQFQDWHYFTNPKTYAYLVYDRTGGNQLDINQETANPHRWGRVDNYTLAPFKEKSLGCLQELAEMSQKHQFDLIFIVQPFRRSVIAANADLEKIMADFDEQTRKILKFDSTHHINAHQLLDLDDSHFADKSHLNIKGANAKTRKLTEIIREIDSP